MRKLKQNLATALCVSLVVNAATPAMASQTDLLTDPSTTGGWKILKRNL